MPLTHVCIWDSQIGFRRIAVDEACKLYPYGVSANSGHFVCELCAQNVLLTAPGVNNRHFRHDPASPNKECDERQTSFDPTYGRFLKSLNSHTMPLRIVVRGTTFTLQLGFFWPSDLTAYCEKVQIIDDFGQTYEYSFVERIGTTYLDVGTVPSKSYWLHYINASSELKKYWANKAQGVDTAGTFFDSQSGRMLQLGGKAYSENTYYLLQKGALYSYSYRDIEASEITHIQVGSFSTWYLYKIRVKRFSENAAKFFLKRSIFLTEKPTKFYPIWPSYIEDPYFIYHNNSEFYFYLCGDDAELKAYPATANAVNVTIGRLYKLYSRGREQLVSLGKSGALGFSYLIREPLNREAPLPAVIISDHAGEPLNEEKYSKLPKLKLISVSCKFDGKAVLKRRGKIDYVYRLSAEQDTIIDGLVFNTEIYFYQGCDCVRTIQFEQERSSTDILKEDQILVEKLRTCSGPMIPVSHAIGAIANKYGAYPQTRQWLYTMLRRGEISRKALQVLKGSIPNNIGGNSND